MNKKTVEFFINNILMFYGLFDDEYGDEFKVTAFDVSTPQIITLLLYIA